VTRREVHGRDEDRFISFAESHEIIRVYLIAYPASGQMTMFSQREFHANGD
jgi:hypothetical protein